MDGDRSRWSKRATAPRVTGIREVNGGILLAGESASQTPSTRNSIPFSTIRSSASTGSPSSGLTTSPMSPDRSSPKRCFVCRPAAPAAVRRRMTCAASGRSVNSTPGTRDCRSSSDAGMSTVPAGWSSRSPRIQTNIPSGDISTVKRSAAKSWWPDGVVNASPSGVTRRSMPTDQSVASGEYVLNGPVATTRAGTSTVVPAGARVDGAEVGLRSGWTARGRTNEVCGESMTAPRVMRWTGGRGSMR